MDQKFTIKIASKGDLPLLEKHLGIKGVPWLHTSKLEDQEKGEGIWLVAWKKDIPVGYLQVRWTGTKDNAVQKYITHCAHLETFGVVKDLQGQGIGTELVKEAEKLTKEKGFNQIGIAVGSTDNPRARSLYERLGYTDWGHGDFTTSWEYMDENGKKGTESEVCVYLLKNL